MNQHSRRTVKTKKQIANLYGISVRTLMKYIFRNEKLTEELEAHGWEGGKFYPKHQDILIGYFGDPTDTNVQ